MCAFVLVVVVVVVVETRSRNNVIRVIFAAIELKQST